MAFSQKEQEIIDWGVSNGKSKEEVKKALAKFRSDQPLDVSDTETGGFVADFMGDIRETGQAIAGQVTGAREEARNIRQRVTEGETSTIAGTFQTIGQGLKAGAGAIGETVIGAGKAILPQSAEDFVGEQVERGATAIAQTEPIQRLITKYNQLDPETQRNIDATLGITEGLGTILGAGPASRATRETLRDVSKATTQRTAQIFERTREGTAKATPEKMKQLFDVQPENREAAVSALTKSYEDSFISDKTSTSNKLDKIARESSFGDVKLTKNDLVKELAEEGYLPIVEGKLANMNHIIDDLDAKRAEIVNNEIIPALTPVEARVSLDGLKQMTEERIRTQAGGADLKKLLRENEKTFDNFKEKYQSDDITALQLNEIRVEMNDRTKAFNREAFEQDVSNQIGSVARERLDEVAPSVRESNKKIGRLFRMEETARAINNKPIDVGVLGSQLGRMAGATALGASGLATGSGSLVLAGIAAHFGGEAFANFLRRRAFRPELKDAIIKQINDSPEVRGQLLEQVTGEDKTLIKNALKTGAAAVGVGVIQD